MGDGDDNSFEAQGNEGVIDISAAEASIRSRMSRRRTKTGCLTCRRRRIKCDEDRPICLNCIRSRRHCEGYVHRAFLRPPTVDYMHFQNGATSITFPPGAMGMPTDMTPAGVRYEYGQDMAYAQSHGRHLLPLNSMHQQSTLDSTQLQPQPVTYQPMSQPQRHLATSTAWGPYSPTIMPGPQRSTQPILSYHATTQDPPRYQPAHSVSSAGPSLATATFPSTYDPRGVRYQAQTPHTSSTPEHHPAWSHPKTGLLPYESPCPDTYAPRPELMQAIDSRPSTLLSPQIPLSDLRFLEHNANAGCMY